MACDTGRFIREIKMAKRSLKKNVSAFNSQIKMEREAWPAIPHLRLALRKKGGKRFTMHSGDSGASFVDNKEIMKHH